MLSIVISSYREHLFHDLSQNISDTIGDVEYEIIKINNPGKMGISKAYNNGGEIANYEYLLFIHEDIKFLKKGWGLELIKNFSLDRVGLIGVAGGVKKFKFPTGHDLGIKKYRQVFVVHKKWGINQNKHLKEPIRTKTLDGVFLAITRVLWEDLKFNENLKGFHFYDLDISLRASVNLHNYVNPNILLEHYSLGNFGDDWVIACLKFHQNSYNFDLAKKEEISQLRKFWFQRLIFEDICFKNRLKFTLHMGVDRKSIRHALDFLLKK